MKKLHSFLIANALFLIFSCTGYKFAPDITVSDVDHHIRYLASDELQGRYPGTPGDQMAGDYIEKTLGKLHLQTYRQDFTFLKSVRRGADNYFEISGNAISAEQFTPFGFSKDTLINTGVVFVGYGLSVKADSFEWDDYKSLDVKGKWVMAIRGYPEIRKFEDYLSAGSEDRDKAMLAGDKGAAGIILVSGKANAVQDQLVKVSERQARVSLPAFQIKHAIADQLLKQTGQRLEDIESSIVNSAHEYSFLLKETVSARSHVENIMGTTGNRFAMIEGSDPILKTEFIVIGAHYDHLGMGGPGSSSRRPDTIAVHNGADDNASGVAAMLELAGLLNQNKNMLKRSVILAAFGGEEMGLLGSKYFVNHLPVNMTHVVSMINLDMVGRLDNARGLQIGGTGTSVEADSLISMANKTTGLKISKSREGSGPSDHSSFYGKNIPVFFITTGAHTDYHTPDDDADRINMQGVRTVSSLAYNLAFEIASMPGELTFREAGPKETASPGYRFKVTLGFMPDFTDNDIQGVRVDFVSKGKAAERGGIRNGDIITAIDGLAVKNIYDYMYRLGKLSKNQIISVEVLREGKKEVMIIQL